MLIRNAFLLTGIWYVTFASPAHAYFDLGTGTYMLQLIFGFGAVFWLSFKKSIVDFFKKKKNASHAPAVENVVPEQTSPESL